MTKNRDGLVKCTDAFVELLVPTGERPPGTAIHAAM